MNNLIRAILTVWLSVSTLMSSSAHLSIGGMDTEGSEGTLFIMIDSDVEITGIQFSVSGVTVTGVEQYEHFYGNLVSYAYSDSIVSTISSQFIINIQPHKGLIATLSYTGFDGGEICIIDSSSGYADPATCENGDMNGDGILNGIDHYLLVGYVMGYDIWDVNGLDWSCADVNGDNYIDVFDMLSQISMMENIRYTFPNIIDADFASIPVTVGSCVDGGKKIAFVNDDGFQTIQNAIDVVDDGYTIQVAPGTYTGDGNIDLDFDGKNISLISEDGPEATIIDCGDTERGITFWSGEDSTSVLDGFTITNGNRSSGGGIYIEGSSPSIRNCIITNCSADDGGGMYLMESTSSMTDVTFSGNTAVEYGGGMFLDQSSPTLTGVTFTGNTVGSGSGNTAGSGSGNTEGSGGGMFFYALSNPTLIDVIFSGNSANMYGGGMFLYSSSPTLTGVTFSENTAEAGGGGMGLAVSFSTPTLTDVTFSNNTAGEGGGMLIVNQASPTLTGVTFNDNTAEYDGGGIFLMESTSSMTDVTFRGNTAGLDAGAVYMNSSSPILTDVIFSDNTAEYDGGGMYMNNYSHPILTDVTVSDNTAGSDGGGIYLNTSSPTLTNVTVSDNTAEAYGGGIHLNNSTPTIINSILWDNSPQQILNDYGSTDLIFYSDIQGGLEGEGNIDADPLFTDPENGDYTLQEGSPCIDAGTADTDGDGTDDITNYFGSAPDMGAYEYGAIYGCSNNDECAVNASCVDNNCVCNAGYEGSGLLDCADIDNCVNQTCSGNGICEDGVDSYTCSCYAWYAGVNCESDIDECLTDNGGCGDATYYSCTNNVGATATCSELSLFNALIPEDFNIHSIYPNPFNPVTNIVYGIPEYVRVQIVVFNLNGKQVGMLINDFQDPGYHSVSWEASSYPSGIYFIRMISGKSVQTQKLMLVK